MPKVKDAKPQVSVRLYKNIGRITIDGQTAVSTRYAGKADYIDLTPYLGDGAAVVTTKSVRDPAGAFSITFANRPNVSGTTIGISLPGGALETVYGLVEPMDVVEIRCWGGLGAKPSTLPIKMRGFVSKVSRSQSMSSDGKPVRTVVVSGQDFGKILQIYQVLYLRAYDGADGFLTTYNLWEKFGIQAENTMKSGDFVRSMIEKIINPFIAGFMPTNSPMPKAMKLDIAVSHGVINNSYQSQQGSVYDLLKFYGDVGLFNELFTEDREDGTYVVYRPMPALHITKPKGAKNRKIQDDSPDPIYVSITDDDIQSISTERSDANVANFFWVNNERYDLIGDVFRKQAAIAAGDPSVSLKDYANAAPKFYGLRPLYGETQQSDDDVKTLTSGLDAKGQEVRDVKLLSWLDNRRQIMMDINRDNSVFETGSARIKGGPMRPAGKSGVAEAMKAGDYVKITQGNLQFEAYVTQITDEFFPFQSYTSTLQFERGTGFVTRAQMNGGTNSPWLAEQATRTDNPFGKLG